MHVSRLAFCLLLGLTLPLYCLSASCPGTLHSLPGGVVGGSQPACCRYAWAEPSVFGTEAELSAAGLTVSTSIPLCTSASNLTELVQAQVVGRVTPATNCSSECGAWAPPPDFLCCTPTSSPEVPYSEDITKYHAVAWVPLDLCPASSSPSRLLGVELNDQEDLQCPSDLTESSPQQLTFGDGMEQFFEDDSTYVLTFHRKSHLSPVSIKFSVVDASGATVVPGKELTFTSASSSQMRRHLLKKGGGGSFGGGRSSSSGGRSYSSGGGSSSSGGWSSSSSGAGMTSSSGRTYSSTTSTAAGYTRYTNSAGYTVPTRTDFTSGSVARGATVATLAGGGATYWGSRSFSPSSSSSASRTSTHYGAPTNFGSAWYSGGNYRPVSYGYSGPSRYSMALPIIIWSRPYGCGYYCHYHHHHRGNNQQEQEERNYLTLSLDCDMSMDLVMDAAFVPSAFQKPFTLNIDYVTATVGEATNVCEPESTALNQTSAPDSPALFATFVKMEEVEFMESSSLSSCISLAGVALLSLLAAWLATP